MGANLEVFERGVRVQRKKIRILILIFAAVPVGGLIWGLTAEDADRMIARMTAFSGLGIIFVIAMMIGTFRRHKGLIALEKPEEIYWFYSFKQPGGQVLSFGLGLKGGKIQDVLLASGKDQEEAAEALAAHAPHAMRGYTQEAHAMFEHFSEGMMELAEPGASAQDVAVALKADLAKKKEAESAGASDEPSDS